jgi:hypothetical protein
VVDIDTNKLRFSRDVVVDEEIEPFHTSPEFKISKKLVVAKDSGVKLQVAPSEGEEYFVDFCSFGQVFSRGLSVGMWESSLAPRWTLRLVKTTFGVKLGLHGFGGGLCGFVLGLHTHKKV